jgi:hypothetical protein
VCVGGRDQGQRPRCPQAEEELLHRLPAGCSVQRPVQHRSAVRFPVLASRPVRPRRRLHSGGSGTRLLRPQAQEEVNSGDPFLSNLSNRLNTLKMRTTMLACVLVNQLFIFLICLPVLFVLVNQLS